MASKRINITLDEESIESLDAISSAYGMNRSESIRFAVELLEETGLLTVLENVALDAIQERAERYGISAAGKTPNKNDMLKAARAVTVSRDC